MTEARENGDGRDWRERYLRIMPSLDTAKHQFCAKWERPEDDGFLPVETALNILGEDAIWLTDRKDFIADLRAIIDLWESADLEP